MKFIPSMPRCYVNLYSAPPCRCEGRNPVEFVGIDAYLSQGPSTEEQRDALLLNTLQGTCTYVHCTNYVRGNSQSHSYIHRIRYIHGGGLLCVQYYRQTHCVMYLLTNIWIQPY